jgi:hypothetical protein
MTGRRALAVRSLPAPVFAEARAASFGMHQALVAGVLIAAG